MTTKRVNGPTPAGGDYSVGTYVRLETMEEVDEAEADGIVIAEYERDGTMLAETVGRVARTS